MNKQQSSTTLKTSRCAALGLIATLLAGTFITAAFFWTARKAEANRFQIQFTHDASLRANLITEKLDQCLLAINALQAYYNSSDSVDRREFAVFALPFLAEQKELQALEWIPSVLNDRRNEFEETQRQNGLGDFRIWESDADGRHIPAVERMEHYPVLYVEPMQGEKELIGFDLGSEPSRLAAIEKARDTGQAAVTKRMQLPQENWNQAGFIVFLPVYQKNMPTTTVPERRAALEGLVNGVFRAGDTLASALDTVAPEGLSFDLIDLSAPQGSQLLHHWIARVQSGPSWRSTLYPSQPQYLRKWNFTDHQWAMRVTTNSAYMDNHYNLDYWLIPPIGIVLTVLMELYLYTILSQRSRMERMVRDRTAELRHYQENLEELVEERAAELKRTNETLKKEVNERKQAEDRLQKSEERLRLLLNSTAEAIYGVDLYGICTFCNPSCVRILGYNRQDDLLGKNMHWLIHHSHADKTPYLIEDCRIYQAFRKSEGLHADDEVFWRANGSSFPAEYWSFPQRVGDEVVGAVVAFVDITDASGPKTSSN